MSNPWTKFFWSDWETDPGLKLCSFAAQGLWMRMLCIAAAHEPMGLVAVQGRALDARAIARMTGGEEAEVVALLAELSDNGVYSTDRHGRIFSRRMTKDASLSKKRAESGSKGGKNRGKNEKNSEKTEEKTASVPSGASDGNNEENSDLLKQNPSNYTSKPPSKTQAPLVIAKAITSQKPEARSASARDDEHKSEFEQRCRSLAQLINLTRPIAEIDRRQMRQWLVDELDFDWHIVEGARRVVAREEAKGGAVRSFKYLDGGIREYHAEWLAERRRFGGEMT